MYDISQENVYRLDRLFNHEVWAKTRASDAEQIRLIQELGLSNQPALIPEIVWLLGEADGPTWGAAAASLHRLLEPLGPLEVALLDDRIRAVRSYDPAFGRRWRELQPVSVSRFTATDFAASVCGLASCHSNGFVREAAVKALSTLWNGNGLTFLLIRTNDWVPAVRETAARAVRERLTPDHAALFLKNLRLVLRLERCSRSEKGLVGAVWSLLRRPECGTVLQAGLASADRAVRRALFQMAAEAGEPGGSPVLRTAFGDPEPIVRAWAARRFLPEVPELELAALAKELLKDRFMPVRRDALWALASRLPESARDPLRRALVDRSSALREVARHFLGRSGVDLVSFYRDLIQEAAPETLSAALRGLGETGQQGDADRVRPFLSAGEPRLRRAAVYALGNLDRERFLPEFLVALADVHAGVSREAVRASLPGARRLDLPSLVALFQQDPRPFVRKHVLMLLQRFGKWERLPPLLCACRDSDPVVAEIARAALRNWIGGYNTSFAAPTSGQIRESRQALEACSGLVSEALLAEIRSCVSTFEGPG